MKVIVIAEDVKEATTQMKSLFDCREIEMIKEKILIWRIVLRSERGSNGFSQLWEW
jgi:hypothetical protein